MPFITKDGRRIFIKGPGDITSGNVPAKVPNRPTVQQPNKLAELGRNPQEQQHAEEFNKQLASVKAKGNAKIPSTRYGYWVSPQGEFHSVHNEDEDAGHGGVAQELLDKAGVGTGHDEDRDHMIKKLGYVRVVGGLDEKGNPNSNELGVEGYHFTPETLSAVKKLGERYADAGHPVHIDSGASTYLGGSGRQSIKIDPKVQDFKRSFNQFQATANRVPISEPKPVQKAVVASYTGNEFITVNGKAIPIGPGAPKSEVGAQHEKSIHVSLQGAGYKKLGEEEWSSDDADYFDTRYKHPVTGHSIKVSTKNESVTRIIPKPK